MEPLFTRSDYRGATVEDLDIRPAISINPSTRLDRAMEVAFENEFTYLPVIHETNKRLLGVLHVGALNSDTFTNGALKPIAKNHMLWFSQAARQKHTDETLKPTPLNTKILRPRGKQYQVLTPMTPLEQLAAFFNAGNFFAIITNGEGSLVYGVVTPDDLLKYEQARPKL